jgi:hypothetical protein
MGAGMERKSLSVSPDQVAGMLERGVGTEKIAKLLVATGTWSDAGAEEIVATLAQSNGDAGGVIQPVDLGWPGPPEDPPPLFA